MGKRAPKVCCSVIGHKNTNTFWHQSEARTAATVWNWSGKTMFPGAHVENFCRALSSDPTDCPWISDDDFTAEYDYIDSLCTAVLSPQTKSRRETSVSQSLSPRFFLGEERLYTGYYIEWQFYCLHWSLANCWPPREACIRLKDWCKMWLNWQKDPSTFFFFSSFDNDQLANIHWRCRIERLKIRKHTKFKCDTLKASKDIAPQGTKYYTLVNLGISCAVSQYHVANRARTRERACLSRALRASTFHDIPRACSQATYHIQTWHLYLSQGVLFSRVDRFLLTGPSQKWKKPCKYKLGAKTEGRTKMHSFTALFITNRVWFPFPFFDQISIY